MLAGHFKNSNFWFRVSNLFCIASTDIQVRSFQTYLTLLSLLIWQRSCSTTTAQTCERLNPPKKHAVDHAPNLKDHLQPWDLWTPGAAVGFLG